MSKRETVSIVGFGRFGQLLASILASDFNVQVYDKDSQLKKDALEAGIKFVNLDELLQAETIFYCVPISSLRAVILEHIPLYKSMKDNKVIVDVSSVKTYPKQVFQKLLPRNYQVLLTHPMFGPDSVKSKGLAGQTLVVDKNGLSEKHFAFWNDFFIAKQLNVIEMSAEEHDLLAAKSQSVTHIVGRILDEFGFEPTAIDTLGTQRLYGIKEQTCNDTWQLFVDLQTFNPYAIETRTKLTSAFNNISNRLNEAQKSVEFSLEKKDI